MRNYSERVAISPETKKLLDDVKKEWKKHHPDCKDLKLTYNYMIKKLAQIYMKM